MVRLILASASPRRIELLHHIGLEAEVRPANADETIDGTLPPDRTVEELSYRKAAAALKEQADFPDECIVIGADTVVVLDGAILGKPADEEDAYRMLKMLSNARNTVYTGVTLLRVRNRQITQNDTFSCKTDVYTFSLSEKEIQEYIGSGEPMDKAGAYGIQGIFGRYVKKIDGDYSNVVGLPSAEVYQHLKKMLNEKE